MFSLPHTEIYSIIVFIKMVVVIYKHTIPLVEVRYGSCLRLVFAHVVFPYDKINCMSSNPYKCKTKIKTRFNPPLWCCKSLKTEALLQ